MAMADSYRLWDAVDNWPEVYQKIGHGVYQFLGEEGWGVCERGKEAKRERVENRCLYPRAAPRGSVVPNSKLGGLRT